MFEAWRRYLYRRYKKQVASTENFSLFEQFASGPWTPEMVSKMPWDILVQGPRLGAIDHQTRKVIDMEMARRAQPISPIIANLVSLAALGVSIFALCKTP